MLNYENCLINISEKIDNKEKLKNFKNKGEKFNYLYIPKFNGHNYIVEKHVGTLHLLDTYLKSLIIK